MNSRFFKITVIWISFLSISVISQPAYAIDGSRFLTWFLFFSGLGSSAAGAIIQGQANGIYDEYMHSAVQSEMDKLISDYESKHNQSVIASKVGIGLTISAILLSLIDAVRIPQPEVQKIPNVFGFEHGPRDYQIAGMDEREFRFVIGYRF